MIRLTNEDRLFLRSVFAFTWLSSLVIVLVGLIVTGGAIITFSLNHSAFKQDLVSWEQSHNNSLSITGRSTQDVTPTLANSWPLIFVWAVVGLLTYTVAASIVRLILQTIEFRRELDYVHANRRSMLENTIEHIVMRLIAAILLVTLALLFVYHVLPYTIKAGRISAQHVLSGQGIEYALISFVLTGICAYLASVMLRLTLGRARVFSSK